MNATAAPHAVDVRFPTPFPVSMPVPFALPAPAIVLGISLAAAGVVAQTSTGLPDPHSYVAVGWMVVVVGGGAFAALKALDALLTFWKKHLRADGSVYASVKELEKLRTEVDQRMKEQQAYVHKELHELKDSLNVFRVEAHNGREGTNNRINATVELLQHMRGQMDGVLMASRALVDTAERAADRADKTAERVAMKG